MTIWWTARNAAEVPDGDGWLTESERAIAADLAIDKRRREWRMGRWAAKQLLASIDSALTPPSVSILAAEDGAPEAFRNGGRLDFSISISHRGSTAVAAACDHGVVGCDLEAIEPRSARFVADFFTAAEAAAIDQLPEVDKSLACAVVWSAKEAALKVRRTGLRRDTRSIEVELGATLAASKSWAGLAITDHVDGGPLTGWWRVMDGELVLVVASDAPESGPPPDIASGSSGSQSF
ncbi:MAG: 4'-phosphopantetheinyl transferase superfamily protein [Deltaproteobacteria bacterium]|nr:4'-phosphopantetheinyl transferase superfamily protein [Deltaproteobacteria bacterium]